jgi:hypothetical protein
MKPRPKVGPIEALLIVALAVTSGIGLIAILGAKASELFHTVAASVGAA